MRSGSGVPAWASSVGYPALTPEEAARRTGLVLVWDETAARHGPTLLVAALEDGCVRLFARGIRELADGLGRSVTDVTAEALAHEVLHAAAARAGVTPGEAALRGLAKAWAQACCRRLAMEKEERLSWTDQ